MRFSIIVPVYNIEKYLSECIEHVCHQSFVDFECILVDDGSTDWSPFICDRFAKIDDRITVIHKENGGLTSARKAGCLRAKGDYILAVDGDDYIDEDCLEQLSRVIDDYSPDVVAFDFRKYPSIHNDIVRNEVTPGLYRNQCLEVIKDNFLFDERKKYPNKGTLNYSIWSKAVKREKYVAAQLEIPDYISMGEDILLNIKIFRECESIYVSNYVGYNYRVDNSSITRGWSESRLQKTERLIECLIGELGDDNRVNVIAFKAVMIDINEMAAASNNYRVFLDKITKKNFSNIWIVAKKATFKKVSTKWRIKQFLFNHNRFMFLYMINIRNRNRGGF